MAIDDIEIGVEVDVPAFRRGVDAILDQSRRMSRQIERIGKEISTEFGIDQLTDSFDILFGTVTDGIDRVLELRDAAREAGQTINEFSGGAFTREDVEVAEDFKEVIEDLRDLQAEIALTIGPEITEFMRDILPGVSQLVGLLNSFIGGTKSLATGATDIFFQAQRDIGSGIAELGQFLLPGQIRSNTVAATQARQRAAGIRTSGISLQEGAEIVIQRSRDEQKANEAALKTEKHLLDIKRTFESPFQKALRVKIGANP